MDGLLQNSVLVAFLLTAFAGLSTGIGGITVFASRQGNRAFLSGSLGFSAGVMIYVSFVELFTGAHELLTGELGETGGAWATAASFFGGVFLIALIDFFVPKHANPHDPVLTAGGATFQDRLHLTRVGLLTALAIGLHNFPEGAATFFAALSDPQLGVSIAIAIAIHNIPEGISIAVPIYAATGNRAKAFWYSFLSGVSEPAGALIAYAILRTILSPLTLGIAFASVAGIMVFVSLDTLIPNAKRYAEGHESVYGLIGGMAVMAISLLLL
ncbi:MAG: zinc transporter ZupT [Candidatus Eisenbacteria bacterium]|nr:zinc transporter ZupT [Candidatus Eisenbacteria bacterium]